MISKNRLKELATYKQQKHCEDEGVFVVEGAKLAAEALKEHAVIHTVCASHEWLAAHTELVAGVECFEVTASDMERISNMKTPNEVWMLVERTAATVEATVAPTLVLDHLQDPGNLGTIIRTADWFGIRHIVCSPDTASCYNPKVVQATMGGIFRTRVCYTSLPEWLARCGKPVYGTVLDGESLFDIPLQKDSVIVVGNESRGISNAVAAHVTQRITIPNYGGSCESLNASVATAIVCAAFYQKK